MELDAPSDVGLVAFERATRERRRGLVDPDRAAGWLDAAQRVVVGNRARAREVADICARVSDGLLDPAQTYVLEIAALLHDIGKIGIRDAVLLKPGRLTEEERRVIRRKRVAAARAAKARAAG